MGQYYKVVNLDKKEYLHPHKFKDGLKLLEFGCSGSGTMTGLAVLLSDGNGRGSGDLHSEKPIIGSWAGDRIVITGDYADPRFTAESDESTCKESADISADTRPNLYTVASTLYRDVSDEVIAAMSDDPYVKRDLKERGAI